MSDCYKNDWLYSSNASWTLIPDTSGSEYVINFRERLITFVFGVRSSNEVKPTVYLNSFVRIASGTGSSTDSFILSE